ncbi:MAG TPA: response regulator, partial [Thermoanaerobaculia bacterium]|nr:response regulator [Thermoanaerobaculia bacterium]
DDVLDFSRIEARKLQLQPVDFPLRPMLADAMKALGVIAASKKLTLSYLVRADVPEVVHGDPVRLRQILFNLVGNAVKFTKQGEVSVQVSANGDAVRFDVCDTGIGVAPSARQRIFQPFMQADTSHSRRHSGTGLGLAIVVRLLDAMGGSIDVSSRAEGGSVFGFRVPLAGSGSAQRRPWELALAELRLAIVEPANMAREALAETLRARGMIVSAYANADEVPAEPFACAVTSDPRVRVQPKVVIISPFDEQRHSIEVTRPVSERELLDAVGAALGLAAPPVDARAEAPMPAARSLRVLLVEDSEVNREVLAEMLRRLGHAVAVARDGEGALAQLDAGSFDVVFMDVQLPGIDGLEVTRRFQASGGTTPILALTAHTARESRDRCLAAGMKGVLTKPVDAAQLAAALRPWSGGNEALLEMVGGNPALLDRVRDAFRRQTPELLASVRESLARGDNATLARAVHTLKGSLSHFTMSRAASIARDVEVAVKAGDLPHAEALLPSLEKEIAELQSALAQAATG